MDVNPVERGRGPSDSTIKRCRKLRARQFGLIRRDQAIAAGMTDRQIEGRLSAGKWVRLSTGIYLDPSAAVTWEQAVLSAVFRGGPGAAASGACAAALWSLPGFGRERVEITSPRRLRNVPFVAHLGTIPSDQMERVGPIPVTNAARTLIDLAGTHEQRPLEDALDDALRRGLTSLARLRWALQRIDGKGKPGVHLLRDLVKLRADGKPIPESVLETRLWGPLRRLGAPAPERQYPVELDGQHYRIDFAFPHTMVAIEAQSYIHHNGRTDWRKDYGKANVIRALGWQMVYVTWEDLHDPDRRTFQLIRRMLFPELFSAN